jgi:DNA repair ATPase RecN
MRGGCMVFDEVDAGIGGAVAEIVGRELRALGEQAQVLCVTHLPQVAAQGHQHLRVAKRHRWQAHAHQRRATERRGAAWMNSPACSGVSRSPSVHALTRNEMLAKVAKAAAAPAVAPAPGTRVEPGGATASAGGRRPARPRPART